MFTHSYRQSRLPCWAAFLAVAGLLLWPALASANCCCKRSERDAEKQTQTNTASCCAVRVSCCGASTRSCQQSSTGDSLPRDCQCDDCCSDCLPAIASQVSRNQNKCTAAPLQLVLVDKNLLTANTDKKRLSLLSANRPFLLAQDHCALICRWQK